MVLIDELKEYARILHREASAGDSAALRRLGRDVGDADGIQRRHCLAVLAKELGFAGWPHAVGVFEGTESANYGTLLYSPQCAAHSNVWCSTYEEAVMAREHSNGYLFPYKRQFFVAESHLLVTIGLDPDHADWQEMGRDWVRPKSEAARGRLYAARVHQRFSEIGAVLRT